MSRKTRLEMAQKASQPIRADLEQRLRLHRMQEWLVEMRNPDHVGERLPADLEPAEIGAPNAIVAKWDAMLPAVVAEYRDVICKPGATYRLDPGVPEVLLVDAVGHVYGD